MATETGAVLGVGQEQGGTGRKPGTFRPGQSGNPRGRPRASGRLSEHIAKATREGREIWEFFLSVMRGEVGDRPFLIDGEALRNKNGDPIMIPPPIKDRMDAAKWLAERQWGKTPTVAQPEEDADGTDDELPPEFLKLMSPPPPAGEGQA